MSRAIDGIPAAVTYDHDLLFFNSVSNVMILRSRQSGNPNLIPNIGGEIILLFFPQLSDEFCDIQYHLLPSSAEVNKVWMQTSAPHTCYGIVLKRAMSDSVRLTDLYCVTYCWDRLSLGVIRHLGML